MAGIFYFEEGNMIISEMQVKMKVSLIGTGKYMWKLRVMAFVASVLGVSLTPILEDVNEKE